jgi:preprotein translocase subunit SecG
MPFSGIAFLWFIGVLRDRIGQYEDRFFATVFFGSGLLFLAMLFACSAIAGGILMVYRDAPGQLMGSGIYMFGRAVTYQIMQVYTMKMAGVFMISTCTLSIRTGIIPRWMTLLGYALALLLLLSLGYLHWVPVVFPLWVLLISVYILLANLTKRGSASLGSSGFSRGDQDSIT